MRNVLVRAPHVWIAVLIAGILVCPSSVQAFGILNTYVEVGDAGDSLSNPQFITGGPYDSIFGNIDSVSDTADVYAFHWIGGQFEAEFFSGSDPTIALYDFSQNLLGSATGIFPLLQIGNVTAGNYLFAITGLTGTDPGYSVDFRSASHPVNTLLISAVPEPASILLFGAGLLGLGLRKKKGPTRKKEKGRAH